MAITEHFDLPVLDWIAENLHNPVLDRLMPPITYLANGGIFWVLLAVVLLAFSKTRKAGFAMGAALLMGFVVCNMTINPLVARMRPCDYQRLYFGKEIPLLVAAPMDFSFPSGHTLASFESALVLTAYHRKWGVGALVLAGLIAFSRLYLYVHYPPDVLFSLVLSVAIAFAAVCLVEKADRRIKAKRNQ